MPKFKNRFKKFFVRRRLFSISLLIFLPFLLAFLAYNLYFWGKIYPGVSLAGIDVGGKTPTQALTILGATLKIPSKITLASPQQSFEVSLNDIGVNYDMLESVRAAFEITRTGNILYDFQERARLIFTKKNLGLRLTLDEQKLEDALANISAQIAVEPVYPSVSLVNGAVVVDKGKAGSDLDLSALRVKIGETLTYPNDTPIEIPIKIVNPTISDEEAAAFGQRAEKLKDKSLSLKFEYQTFTYKANELLALLDAKSTYNDEATLDLVATLANLLNRPPHEPVFVFEEGRVKEFEPATDGVAVQQDELRNLLVGGLKELETQEGSSLSLEIPVAKSPPKINTGDVNNLGIKELIGRGTSRFRGSIPNRIHNITLSASKFKGVLVPPGETMSFNQILGDVSELTGFRQAYIIKDGKTVLGDGGGVCQVSTTLFRAALNAGLPITERQAHAYRVGYYEQDSPPGFDATVFAPSPDLKFKNDTPGHILIQSSVDTKTATLVFEIYGTSDGRIATTSKPVITNQVPPPEDLYVDDPTLPSGTVKQIDYKAWGAKVTFNYLVQRGREVVYKKTFVSSYRPWQAVYLRGTGPAQ